MSFKKSITTAIITLLVSTSANAETLVNNKESGFKVIEPANHSIETGLVLDSNRVSFIYPEVQSATLSITNKQNLVSNEYWETITGAQLKKGVELFTSIRSPLIRLAPKVIYASGAPVKSIALNEQQLSIVQGRSLAEAKTLNSGTKLISNRDMQQAGFNDGSVAAKLNLASDKPVFLRTSQSLADDAEYLLHVKEKDSKQVLEVNAVRNVIASTSNNFPIGATLAGTKLSDTELSLEMIDAQGERQKVSLQNGHILLPDSFQIVGGLHGLNEIIVNLRSWQDNRIVRRTVKIPFVQVSATAILESINPSDMQSASSVKLPISVLEPGKYAVTATLAGVDRNGEVMPLQTAAVSEFFNQSKLLQLPFNLTSFPEYSEFTLLNVKLVDQSRMMTLAFLPTLSDMDNQLEY